MRSALFAFFIVLALLGCRSDGKGTGPAIPASSDPEGKDLIVGAIIIAHEKPSGGVRIYKIKEVNYFPPPVGDELVMLAFQETGNDFRHASDLWRRRNLTVAVVNVRVQRQMFNQRDYRVIGQEPVTELEKKLAVDDKLPKK